VIDEFVERIFFLLLLGTKAAREALCWKCTGGGCNSVLLHSFCACLIVCVLLSLGVFCPVG
jgi:hypothetical protein